MEDAVKYLKEIRDHLKKAAAPAPAPAARQGLKEAVSESKIGKAVMPAVTNPYVAVVASVEMLGKAYVRSAEMALAWNKGMTEINASTKLSKDGLAQLSDSIMNIAANNTLPLEDAPANFKKVLNAGLGAKDALASFDPILKATKAGFSDVSTVAKATSAIMTNTGWKDANGIMDVLFATVKQGKAGFNDIAKVLPGIIPSATRAGQSFQDTAGAFAFLTNQGFSAKQATGGLQKTMEALAKPEIAGAFEKMGVGIKDAAGKARPMLDIVKDLGGEMAGLSDQGKASSLIKMGADPEAAASLVSMMTNYKQLSETIRLTNDSQGQLNAAIQNAEGPMDVWKIVSNQVGMAMEGIGGTALPIIKQAGMFVLEVINYFKSLWNESALLRDAFSLLGLVGSMVFNNLMFFPRMLFNWYRNIGLAVMWLGEKIGLSTGAFSSMYETVRPYLQWMFSLGLKIADIFYKIATLDFAGAWKSMKEFKLPDINELKKQSKKDIEDHRPKKDARELVNKGQPKEDLILAKKPALTAAPAGEHLKVPGLNGKSAANTQSGGTLVTGQAQQSKNLTINMDVMVKIEGDFVSKNPEVSRMSKRELENWFAELCSRMILNLETSYS